MSLANLIAIVLLMFGAPAHSIKHHKPVYHGMPKGYRVGEQ